VQYVVDDIVLFHVMPIASNTYAAWAHHTVFQIKWVWPNLSDKHHQTIPNDYRKASWIIFKIDASRHTIGLLCIIWLDSSPVKVSLNKWPWKTDSILKTTMDSKARLCQKTGFGCRTMLVNSLDHLQIWSLNKQAVISCKASSMWESLWGDLTQLHSIELYACMACMCVCVGVLH